jgi:hypothetical protein
MDNNKTYFVFDNLDQCNSTLNEINKKRNITNGTWCQPHKNQTENLWLLTYDNKQISDCRELLTSFEEIELAEAKKRGWYFGRFTGSFAREREKLEDIHFVYDSLLSNYGKPNFPATRAIALSFLSACYSLKESLNKKIRGSSLKTDLGEWWKNKVKEQDAKGELLISFHIFMNTEKHGGASAGRISEIELNPIAHMSALIITNHHIHCNPKTLEMSAQGVFMTAYENTPNERRFPVGIHDAVYEIRVKNAPNKHLGQDISNATFLDMMTLIRNYYMNLLFEAESDLGERKNNSSPAILFDGNASMSVKE